MAKFLYALDSKRAIGLRPLVVAHREGAKDEILRMKILLRNNKNQEVFISPLNKKPTTKILSFRR